MSRIALCTIGHEKPGIAAGYRGFARLGARLDQFMQEASDILSNKRQYADDPTYDFANADNSESLFDAYDRGETVGLDKGWRTVLRPAREQAEADRELDEALEARVKGGKGKRVRRDRSLSRAPLLRWRLPRTSHKRFRRQDPRFPLRCSLWQRSPACRNPHHSAYLSARASRQRSA